MKPTINWQKLLALRLMFIDSKATLAKDYWANRQILADYDLTLGARIAWKWTAMLEFLDEQQLAELAWFYGAAPSSLHIADWGCGSGRAVRTFIEHYGKEKVAKIVLNDRSRMATEFARRSINDVGYKEVIVSDQAPESDILLISHVINELDGKARSDLKKWVQKSKLVLWVEPGTPEAAAELLKFSGLVDKSHRLISPQRPVGKSGDYDTKFMHFYATPPQEVYHDPLWSEFERVMKIDYRKVPYCFIALLH